jgi:hypothetical protein
VYTGAELSIYMITSLMRLEHSSSALSEFGILQFKNSFDKLSSKKDSLLQNTKHPDDENNR